MNDREVFTGTGITPLVGSGPVHRYSHRDGVEVDGIEAVDEATERQRFEEARETARSRLQRLSEETAVSAGEEEAAVFDVHCQLLTDPKLESGVFDRIAAGKAAEVAVTETFSELIDRFENLEGRMAERADDLRDLRDRLVAILAGADWQPETFEAGSVIVLGEMLPSEIAELADQDVAGIVAERGGETSHAAILARSMAIPAVTGVDSLPTEGLKGTAALVDGINGRVILEPTSEDRAAVDDEITIIDERVETPDGHRVGVAANVGSLREVQSAVEYGADGIGLFRSEFLFYDRETPPNEDEQYEVYCEALEAFPDDQIVVRTLDVGGDKQLPALEVEASDTSYLGNRGIRLSLSEHGGVFETQLRALLRANAGRGNLQVMFPMVTTVNEFRAARERVHAVAEDLDSEGIARELPSLGVMIETPASVLMVDELAAMADFMSIGTNDLSQYIMAAARDNEAVAHLQDARRPAVLRAIATVAEAGSRHGSPVTVCGELAADTGLTKFFVEVGIDELSMSPVSVPNVKATVGKVRASDRTYVDRILDAGTLSALEKEL